MRRPLPGMEPRWRKPDDRECCSELERLPASLDRAQQERLGGTVGDPPSFQVQVKSPQRGNEDAGEGAELVDAATQSEDLGLEGLFVQRQGIDRDGRSPWRTEPTRGRRARDPCPRGERHVAGPLDELAQSVIVGVLDTAHPCIIHDARPRRPSSPSSRPGVENSSSRVQNVGVDSSAVSLSESQIRDLGVELAGQGTVGSGEWALASLFGLGAPAPSDPGLPAIGQSGFTGVVLDPASYAAVVRALEVLNQGRVLSAPRVLVANHEEATLDSVLQSPFLTTSATNTVATTSYGGTSDAGTSITVSPHITGGDRLRLEYTVSVSTFVGEPTDPVLPPPRQENQLTSVVSLPDGYTVVIGGLDVETETKAVSQVPVLGWIPGIGELFKSRIVSRTKSRFFVFLRCSVLRGQGFEELRYLSGSEMAEAGIEDSWPRLEPRIIR